MPELPNIEPLIRAASRGDRRSEERLFSLLYKFVTASLRKHWRSSFSEDELNDILMNTLEKLLATFRDPEKTEKVIEQGRIFGFVHVVAEHTALDQNRKLKRRDKVFLSYDDTPDDDASGNWESRLQPVQPSSDIADFILGGMETTKILSEIDQKYRKVIEERVGGLEYEEIAENNGISVPNARQIYKRGITMLRQRLIAKNKSVLFSLSVSQSDVLRRLYLKEQIDTPSPGNEDEALEAFYSALVSKGLFIIFVTIGVLS
ncbi:MAG TPA: sigma-70 family RNA polymerase sigma factor [Candidatus Kapabacteria bacterium]|nr:sigma-70 family RNA polymerase sigma factor [Candidatus Kapabacteria bacterium]